MIFTSYQMCAAFENHAHNALVQARAASCASPATGGSASIALRGSGHYRGWRARRQRQQPFQRVRGSKCGTGPLIGTDAANRGNGPCSTSRQRPVDATTAPLLAGSRPGLHLAQPACYSPTMLLPLRVVLQREALPQRRAPYSGDTTKTLKHLFGGDCLSSIGLSDRLQKLRLKFGRNLKGFIRFASKNCDDGTFGQGIPFHDDLSAYDCSSG